MSNKYSVKLNLDIKLFKSDLHPIDFIKSRPNWIDNIIEDPKKVTHFGIEEKYWSNELVNFFEKHNQWICSVEIFYTFPDGKLTIHSDSSYPGDFTKINWVFGGKNSEMIWYEATNNNDRLVSQSVWNTPAVPYTPEEVTAVYAEYLQGPHIVAVGCPHNVVNQSEERFAVSVVFRNNDTKNIDNRPTMEESIEIFKDYIVGDPPGTRTPTNGFGDRYAAITPASHKMKYYNYLNLLGWEEVAEKIKTFLMPRPYLYDFNNNGPWANANVTELIAEVPALVKLFEPLNLTIKDVGFFSLSSTTCNIHRDACEEPIRINIPILNCEGTVTRFFKSTKPPILTTQPNGIPYEMEDSSGCILVASAEVIIPTLLRVREPHNVVLFHNNYPRITCTIKFNEDLEHLLDL